MRGVKFGHGSTELPIVLKGLRYQIKFRLYILNEMERQNEILKNEFGCNIGQKSNLSS